MSMNLLQVPASLVTIGADGHVDGAAPLRDAVYAAPRGPGGLDAVLRGQLSARAERADTVVR